MSAANGRVSDCCMGMLEGLGLINEDCRGLIV